MVLYNPSSSASCRSSSERVRRRRRGVRITSSRSRLCSAERAHSLGRRVGDVRLDEAQELQWRGETVRRLDAGVLQGAAGPPPPVTTHLQVIERMAFRDADDRAEVAVSEDRAQSCGVLEFVLLQRHSELKNESPRRGRTHKP